VKPLAAVHQTACPACDELIRPGDPIVRLVGVGWAHQHCGEYEPPPPANPLCTHCYIHHAGDCA
jgi:hypothetical protein